MRYYLAIDIGASSGRHILFWKDCDGIHMQEVYRFKNVTKKIDNFECWDIQQLFTNVLEGLKRCKKLHKVPSSISIDTWGVDFVLLDKEGHLLDYSIAYRDHSFDLSMEEVFKKIPKPKLYEHTGIQFQQFNTIYQLNETKKRISLCDVSHFLMIPDYLIYCLSGIAINEYTNATTTQLINVKTKDWDRDLMEQLDYPIEMFHDLRSPGSFVGNFTSSIKEIVGFDTQIWTCASHDTGSAFLSVQSVDSIIISSGTWSLIGIHLDKAKADVDSMKKNYTNEGGFHTIRYLKNIMGLWILQEIQRETGHSFQELCIFAEKSTNIDTIIDVNDPIFLKPKHMQTAIDKYCMNHQLAKPSTIGEYVQCVCKSLAMSYKQSIEELEELMNKNYTSITVIGGGVQNEYLNRWIERICKKEVIRGVIEATALGNAICQMYVNGEYSCLSKACQEKLIVEECSKDDIL